MSTTFRRLAYVIIKPRINDKKFRNTEKKNRKWNVLLNKESCANGISLRVVTRIALLD